MISLLVLQQLSLLGLKLKLQRVLVGALAPSIGRTSMQTMAVASPWVGNHFMKLTQQLVIPQGLLVPTLELTYGDMK